MRPNRDPTSAKKKAILENYFLNPEKTVEQVLNGNYSLKSRDELLTDFYELSKVPNPSESKRGEQKEIKQEQKAESALELSIAHGKSILEELEQMSELNKIQGLAKFGKNKDDVFEYIKSLKDTDFESYKKYVNTVVEDRQSNLHQFITATRGIPIGYGTIYKEFTKLYDALYRTGAAITMIRFLDEAAKHQAKVKASHEKSEKEAKKQAAHQAKVDAKRKLKMEESRERLEKEAKASHIHTSKAGGTRYSLFTPPAEDESADRIIHNMDEFNKYVI